MKHLMSITRARNLARMLSKELQGICRCEFEDLWRMELTATERKSYIEIWDFSTKKSYAILSNSSLNNRLSLPTNWRTKPRGALRNEWQPIPEDFVEQIITKYNIL